MKQRVWELAKELGIKGKDLLEVAHENNIKEIHSVLNVLTDKQIEQLKMIAQGNKNSKKKHKPKEKASQEKKVEKAKDGQTKTEKEIKKQDPPNKVVESGNQYNKERKEQTENTKDNKRDHNKREHSKHKEHKQRDHNKSRDQRDSKSRDQRDSKTRDQRDNKTRDQRDNKTRDQRDNKTRDQRDNKTRDQRDNKTRDQRDNKTRDQRDNKTRDQRDNKARSQRDNKTRDQRDNKTRDQRDNKTRSQRDGNVREHKPKDDKKTYSANNTQHTQKKHDNKKNKGINTEKKTNEYFSGSNSKKNHKRVTHKADYQNNRVNKYSNSNIRDRRKHKKKGLMEKIEIVQPNKKIEVTIPVTIKDLSQVTGIRSHLIIQKLSEALNVKTNINQPLDETMVEMIGLEFSKEIKIKKGENQEELLLREFNEEKNPQHLVPRPPVVTFMGHVDHGKTSLLDAIKKSNVTAQEAGGITQHIGAYKVTHNKQSIVFLDTPGHEAFTAMRARGANVTDIVVLVVAADDGVMPQTIEAINHAKAADVPIIVAINKIDKPSAQPEVVMQQLSHHGLIPEKWHGDTICVEVSALNKQGIPDLLEYILLVAEMQELKSNPKRKASGTVLEARIVEGRGVVATLLVQNGSLKRGDNILCGVSHGRIRNMTDDMNKKIKEAGPSTPIEVCGLSLLPEAGDKFYVLSSPSKARALAESREKQSREKNLSLSTRKLTAEEFMRQIQEGETKELRIVLKTDVQGSLEAISVKLAQISHKEVKVKLLHGAVGGINERDIQLADASKALVLGFNVAANKATRDMAEDKKIEIRRYNVIYQLLDDMKQIMSGMLAPSKKEEVTGHVTIRKIIRISKLGNIAGCYVTDGFIERNSQIRIARNGVILTKDKSLGVSTLRRFKEDVARVKSGFECGIKLDGFDDIKEGDELEAFKIVTEKRTLE